VIHLDGCEDCIGVFRALQEARTAVRQLPYVELPAGLAASLHFGDRLSAYLDGELASAEVEQVSSHLEVCQDCRIELRDLDSARTAVRALPRLEMMPAEAGDTTTDAASTRSRRRRVAVAVAAVAAAAVVFASGGSPSPTVDRESLANRHSARTSVEQGFAVIPAFASPQGSP
jgi:anti-sigma factor RsiW